MYCCCCCLNFGNDELGNCCSFFSQKIFQIIYLISYGILLIFLIPTISIINWDKLPKINLTLFMIILSIIATCFILGIIVYCYTQQLKPDDITKRKIYIIYKIGLIITIIGIFLSVMEEIFFSITISQASDHFPCDRNSKESIGFFVYKQRTDNLEKYSENPSTRLLNNDYDCYNDFITSAVKGMTFFTLTMIEILSVFSCCFWTQTKREYFPQIKFNNQQNYIQNYQVNQNVNTIPQGATIQTPQIFIINNANNGNNIPYPYPQQYNYNNINGQNLNSQQQKINVNNAVFNYPSRQDVINPNEKNFETNNNLYSSDRNYI